jgi:signal transduction histidine kinase/CheY-like chemotaxis protein
METPSSVGVRQRFLHQESPNGVAKRKRRKSRIIDEPIPKETWLKRKVLHLLSLVFEETAEGKRAMVLALYLAVGPPFALAMLWDLDFYLLDRGFLAVIVLISSGAWTMFQSKEAANGSLVYAVGIAPIIACGVAFMQVFSPGESRGLVFGAVSLAPLAWSCSLLGGNSTTTLVAWLSDMFVMFFILDVAHRGWESWPDYMLVGVIHGLVAWVVGGVAFRLRTTMVEYREAIQQATQASRAKSRFLATVSHELRTPMNAILGMTALALDEIDNTVEPILTPKTPKTPKTPASPAPLSANLIQDYLLEAQSAARSLLALLDDVLDLSRVEAGKMNIEVVEFDLERCVVEGVRHLLTGGVTVKSLQYRDPTFEDGIDCAIYIDPYLARIRKGDPLRVRQIVSNLVGNSVKFTKAPGTITISVVPQEEDWLLFSVCDSGIGIPEDKIASIFAPFVQADDATTRQFGGSGLGLAITTELAMLMGGSCWATSKLGVGSTFNVKVRLPPLDGEGEPFKNRGQHVLMGYSNPLILDIYSRYLIKLGFQVDTASTFKEMAEKIAHDRGLVEGGVPKESYSLCIIDDVMFAKPLLTEAQKLEGQEQTVDVPFLSESRFSVLSLMKHCPPVLITTTPTSRAGIRDLAKRVFARLGLKTNYGTPGDDVYPPEDPRHLFRRKMNYVYKPCGPSDLLRAINSAQESRRGPLQTPALSVSSFVDHTIADIDFNLPVQFNLQFPSHRRAKSAPKTMTRTPPADEFSKSASSASFKSNKSSEVGLQPDVKVQKALSNPKELHILLVEDNPLNTRVATSMLEKMGHTVMHAQNGLEAIEILGIPLKLAVKAGVKVDPVELALDSGKPYRSNVDLILLDVMMPVMDGLTCSRVVRSYESWLVDQCQTPSSPTSPLSVSHESPPLIQPDPILAPRAAVDYFSAKKIDNRSHYPSISPSFSASPIIRASTEFGPGTKFHIPIIGLTANAMNGDDVDCIQAGMDLYLSKPVEMQRLKLCLEKAFS